MSYRHFSSFNVIGGLLWVLIFTYGGYFFGGLDFVQQNIKTLIVAIIFLSVMPAVVEVWRNKRKSRMAG